MSIRTIIFGATGMVGEGVLHETLKDKSVESVLVVGRRSCNVKHEKLTEMLHKDLYDYSAIRDKMKGYNACFFCLGVTSIGKNEEEYRKLTYDLTMAAAKNLFQVNPMMIFCYVSGAGTDSSETGKSMWARVKGKTENDLLKIGFKAMYNFRPGYIKPIKGMKNTLTFAKVFVPVYPFLSKLFPKYVCTLEDVGMSMLQVAETGYDKNILECVDITRLGKMRRESNE